MKLRFKMVAMLVLVTGIMFATSCKKEDPTAPTVTTSDFVAQQNGSGEGGGNVTADGDADVTARGVVIGQTPNPAVTDQTVIKTTDGTGTGAFTSKLAAGKLAPGFTYHVRAYATNSEGTSYGADKTFTVPL
jgi:hypothetical protein